MLKKQTIGLWTIVIIGLVLRMWRCEHAMPYFFHPDELMIGSSVHNMVDTGDLNPRLFIYGSAFLYLATAIIYFLSFFSSKVVSLITVIYVGKGIAIFFSVMNIILIYFLARQLFNDKVAIISSFLMSTIPLDIYIGQTFKVDSILMLWVLLTIYISFQLRMYGSWKWYFYGGVTSGMALGTKYFWPVLVPLFIAHIYFQRRNNRKIRIKILFHYGIWISVYIAVFIFVITNPYIFIDFKSALNDMMYLLEYARYYASFRPWYYLPFLQEVFFVYPIAFGPMYVAFISFIVTYREEKEIIILFLSFPVIYFIFYIVFFPGPFHIHSEPLLPFILIGGSKFLDLWYGDKSKIKKLCAKALFLISVLFNISNIFIPHYNTLGILQKELGKWIYEKGQYSEIMMVVKVIHPTEYLKRYLKYQVEPKEFNEAMVILLNPQYLVIGGDRIFLEELKGYPRIYERLRKNEYKYRSIKMITPSKLWYHVANISMPLFKDYRKEIFYRTEEYKIEDKIQFIKEVLSGKIDNVDINELKKVISMMTYNERDILLKELN